MGGNKWVIQLKFKINVKEGVIELEGDERFVKQYLDEFKSLISSNNFADKEVKNKNDGGTVKKKVARKKTVDKKSPGKKATTKITPERFDIHGSGEIPSLESFLEEKKPGTGNGNIIAVIGYYITELLGEPNFSEGMIEYAYKMLKITRPKHLHQIMINEKNNKDFFESNEDDISKWSLTRTGEIFVADTLPE